MSESGKAVLGVLFLIAGLVAVFAWFAEPPLRSAVVAVCAGLVSAVSLAALLWAQFRRDKAPDYLRIIAKSHFERKGFCFAFIPTSNDGRCVIQLWFQNRYTGPCEATVTLRPSLKFLLDRSHLQALSIGVACPPGGFGRVDIPLPVPREYQGTNQTFDVAADVRYPTGRKGMVHYRDGLNVGSAGVTDVGRIALTLAAAVAGYVVFTQSAKCTLRMPGNVAEDVPSSAKIESHVLWQIGAPHIHVPPTATADSGDAR